jgi:hypothetical protein
MSLQARTRNRLKSFLFVFAWEWSKGIAKLAPTTIHALHLTEENNIIQRIEVPHIYAHSTY